MLNRQSNYKNKNINIHLLKDGLVHELQSEANVSNVLYVEAEKLDTTSSGFEILKPKLFILSCCFNVF